MGHNCLFWKSYFDEAVRPTIERLKEFYVDGARSAFNEMELGADKKVEDTYNRLMEIPVPEDSDPAVPAEIADDLAAGLAWEVMELHNMVNCLTCVALSSIIGKFLGLLLRRELARPWAEPKANPDWAGLVATFRDAGIDLKKTGAWNEVDLMLLVSNALKHGPGGALKKLRKRCSQMSRAGLRDEREVRAVGDEIIVADAFVIRSFETTAAYLEEVLGQFREGCA